MAKRGYSRSRRVNELVREIVAEELERIADPDLGWLTVTGVVVNPELTLGQVYFSTLEDDPEVDGHIIETLQTHRVRLQRAIATQARLRRTPELEFRVDGGVRAGARVEEILANIARERGETDAPE